MDINITCGASFFVLNILLVIGYRRAEKRAPEQHTATLPNYDAETILIGSFLQLSASEETTKVPCVWISSEMSLYIVQGTVCMHAFYFFYASSRRSVCDTVQARYPADG